jgi:hypothetical protein
VPAIFHHPPSPLRRTHGRGNVRAAAASATWRRPGVLFKMIRRHHERGCLLGDGDCLSLRLDGRDGLQTRQFGRLQRLQKTGCPIFCKLSRF